MDTQRLLQEFKTSPLHDAERRGAMGLRFVPELETRYQRHRANSNALFTQFGITLALLLVVAMLAADAVGLEQSYTDQAKLIILGIIIPWMTVCSALSFMPRMRQKMVLISSMDIGVLTPAFIVVWFVMQNQTPGGAPPHTWETLVFIIVFAFFFSGLRYGYAIFIGLASSLVFTVTQWIAGMDVAALRHTGFFLFSANCLGIVGLYMIELTHRREFMAREMLNYLAERDPLTGAVNRRAMEFHLEKVWSQATRDGKGVGVMLVDIDNFKQINDKNGHDGGDKTLVEFAEMLNSVARRPWDLAARYGGDEFVVFLYDIGEQDMQARVEELLEQVRTSAKGFTISIGADHCVATPTVEVEELLRNADRHLYQSKENGRNRATHGG